MTSIGACARAEFMDRNTISGHVQLPRVLWCFSIDRPLPDRHLVDVKILESRSYYSIRMYFPPSPAHL